MRFTDVVGPTTPTSLDDFRYFITFSDEYSSHAIVEFMRNGKRVYENIEKYLCDYGSP